MCFLDTPIRPSRPLPNSQTAAGKGTALILTFAEPKLTVCGGKGRKVVSEMNAPPPRALVVSAMRSVVFPDAIT